MSGSSAADIAEVFDVDPARITTIPHGIDRERFERPTALSPRLRHLALTPYALYLGNIEPRKNLVELAHAFAMPSVRGLGMKLVVAGRPAWNADASMEAIASTDVDYLGFVSDDERVSLMQHAALFVFPSLYEGFGFPVLEAMAAGTPVLTSSRGSLAEVAGPALTIEDLSRDGIAAAVAGSLADLPRLNQSASDGREWVKRFNWSDSVERHLTVYQRLLETAPE